MIYTRFGQPRRIGGAPSTGQFERWHLKEGVAANTKHQRVGLIAVSGDCSMSKFVVELLKIYTESLWMCVEQVLSAAQMFARQLGPESYFLMMMGSMCLGCWCETGSCLV